MQTLDKSTGNADNKNKLTIKELTSRTKDKLKPTAYRLISISLRQQKQLEPEFILEKFRQGQYPDAGRLGRLKWFDPEIRALLPLDDRFHVERNTERLIRNKKFEVTFNCAFQDVIMGCAAITPKRQWTWLSPEIVRAFITLHEMGYAHSVESWQEGELAGGGFGVAIGGYFSVLSQFTLKRDASKVSFVHLHKRLCDNGYLLYDTLEINNHTRQFGAFEIPSQEFKNLLSEALKQNVHFA